ncbi:MAG: hypothetical protein MO846_03340 [Candidatus Devosia symbiotica]|nr:hypothetical protein [Candidatus Devosia symbiotica]
MSRPPLVSKCSAGSKTPYRVPPAVAQVTGKFTAFYKAAAYLESLNPEEKAGVDWIAGRAAITEGLKQLQSDPKTMPNIGD